MSRSIADRAVAALPGDGWVEVTGEGALAGSLRAMLRSRVPSASRGDVAAAIDTTGEPAVIAALLIRLADLGTLVLAGPDPPGPVALDLYADLHVRGLTVVGIAPQPGA